MKAMGKHLTVDMYGCSFDNLESMDFIKSAMLMSLHNSNMTLLEFTGHKFAAQKGLTAIALLTESHMSIHTYPQLGYAAIDIFCCGDNSHPEKAIATLKKLLKPERMKITNIRRGDFGSLSDMKPKVKTMVGPMTRMRSTGAKVFHFLSRSK